MLICAIGILLFIAGARLTFASAVIGTALLLIATPAKYYYFWVLGPLILARAAAFLPRPSVVMGIAAVLYAASVAGPLRMLLIMSALTSDQRLAPNVAAIERTIPPGSIVLANEFWSSIGNRVQYRSLVHAAEGGIRSADYVVLTANGSGSPGVAQSLTPLQEEELRNRFVPVINRLNARRSALFGIPVSKSAWGFGVLVLKNRSPRYSR